MPKKTNSSQSVTKADIEGLRYDLHEFRGEHTATHRTIDGKLDRLLTLMGKYAKTHTDLEHEFTIVKARLERVETQLGLKDASL